MADSLKTVFLASMARIAVLKATDADLALVLIMSELIDEVGGGDEAKALAARLEVKWQEGQAAYARGEV